MTHTPVPWFAKKTEDEAIEISAQSRRDMVPVAEVSVGFSDVFEAEQVANAAFIVRAVNSHQQLVEALKMAKSDHENTNTDCRLMLHTLERIDAALKEAQS